MICHLISTVKGVVLFIQTTAACQLDKYLVSKRTGDVIEIRPRVAVSVTLQ